MPTTCFLDLDGVLADFTAGACRVHGRPYPYHDPAYHGMYQLPEIWQMEEADFWGPLDYQFWADLDLTPDGSEILQMVEDRFGRDNVCILTAPANGPQCAAGKVEWIRTHLPFGYGKQFLIGSGKHFCGHGEALLVDDADKNCVMFRERGSAFLLPRPWNSLYHLHDQALDLLKAHLAET